MEWNKYHKEFLNSTIRKLCNQKRISVVAEFFVNANLQNFTHFLHLLCNLSKIFFGVLGYFVCTKIYKETVWVHKRIYIFLNSLLLLWRCIRELISQLQHYFGEHQVCDSEKIMISKAEIFYFLLIEVKM